MSDYSEFLASKKPRPQATGIEPPPLNSGLFDFQTACVDFDRKAEDQPVEDDSPCG